MALYPGDINLDGDLLSVDTVLNNPPLIEQRVLDIANEQSILTDLFTEGTAPEGGAVIYARATRDNLFPDGDVSARQPGDEFNIVQPTRPEDKLSRAEEYGAKIKVFDETRDRNRAVDFDNSITQMANIVTRKINRRAAETISAVIDEGGDDLHLIQASAKWSDVLAHGPQDAMTNPRELPGSDMNGLVAAAESDQLGIEYKTLLVSPKARAELRTAYGPTLKPLLEDLGLNLKVSVDIPANQAYLVDPGKFGFVSWENRLTVTTWRDEHTRSTWVQTFAGPLFGCTMPGALAVITGTL